MLWAVLPQCQKDMKTQKISYRSAVDAWLAVLVGGTFIWVLIDGLNQGTASFLTRLIIFFIIGLFCFPCRYTITESQLVIRSGVLTWTIDLKDIKRVTLTSNPMSAPAWSLKRIRIEYGSSVFKYSLVSPKDREGFIEELNRRRNALG